MTQAWNNFFYSQFDPYGWHEKIGEGILSEAILDALCMILIIYLLMVTYP